MSRYQGNNSWQPGQGVISPNYQGHTPTANYDRNQNSSRYFDPQPRQFTYENLSRDVPRRDTSRTDSNGNIFFSGGRKSRKSRKSRKHRKSRKLRS